MTDNEKLLQLVELALELVKDALPNNGSFTNQRYLKLKRDYDEIKLKQNGNTI